MPNEESTERFNRNLRRHQNKVNAYFKRLQIIFDGMAALETQPETVESFIASASSISTLRQDFLAAIEARNEFLLTDINADEPDYESLLAFDDLYSRIKYKYDRIIEVREEKVLKCKEESGQTKVQGPRIPKLALRTFDGAIETWPLFYETFKRVIHENSSLSDGEKVQYLVGQLSGKALNICQGYLPTAENYLLIWNALVDRYNDKRLLAAKYIDSLLSLPAVKSGSHSSLETFIDTFSSNIAALKQLQIENLTDFIFIHLGSKKVGLDILKSFETNHNHNSKSQSCSEFIDFLRNQHRILQKIDNAYSGSISKPRELAVSNVRSRTNVKTFVSTNSKKKCVCCEKDDHESIFHCPKFMTLAPPDRFILVKKRKLCINCLSGIHLVRNCKSMSTCRKCSGNHNTLLHFEYQTPLAMQPNSVDRIESKQNNDRPAKTSSLSFCDKQNESLIQQPAVAFCSTSGGACLVAADSNKSVVLLGTAQCYVADVNGTVHTIRVLLDCGSQNNLISLTLCNRLKLQVTKGVQRVLSGVGDVTNPIEGVTSLSVWSKLDKSNRHFIQPLVVRNLTSQLPTAHIDCSHLNYLKNISLADPTYDQPGNIDMIIGADLFARILLPHSITGLPGEPIALSTTFGYVVLGEAPIKLGRTFDSHTYCSFEQPLETAIQHFLGLESVPHVRSLTSEDRACEALFKTQTHRNHDGRYVVSLPFKQDPSVLGDSLQTATRRFYNLERKLINNRSLRDEYDKVIREYLEKGYLVACSGSASGALQYVIPHHAVVRPDKSSTKVRIVLDASMKTSTGFSLNDILHTGLNLQNDIFRVLINFRLYGVAISADIRQMYMQIVVHEHFRQFQRILYRFDPQSELQTFEMTRLPFGLCCSPFMAMRTVKQLVEDEGARFPLAATVAQRDLYMDDIATSCLSADTAIQLANQLIGLFNAGGFELVKFATNSTEVAASLPEAHKLPDCIDLSSNMNLKILGMCWLPAEDVFSFAIKSYPRVCTKRNILSSIARLWDILGLVAPVVLYAKLIIKDLWQDKISWDETPPELVVRKWRQFESELPLLQQLKLPRHVGPVGVDGSVFSLIGFADASEKAYGGVYAHLYNPISKLTHFSLICAKSRVAPLRTVSIPRLELCAMLVVSELMKSVVETYSSRCSVDNVFIFSDSTVALCWVQSPAARWQTFVGNRVAKIQENINPQNCFHISGKENPADCLSRGLTPSQLIDHPLWYHGPSFAHLPITEWPKSQVSSVVMNEMPEQKSLAMTTTTEKSVASSFILYSLALRISSWSKLLRIVVLVLRMLKLIPKDTDNTSVAELYLVRTLQKIHFQKELDMMKSGKKLSPAFLRLNAFIRGEVIRVGGRLSNSELDYDSCHPMILPQKDHITNLIIDYYHRKHMHTGAQLLMSIIRQRFWILSARNIVRKRIQLCNFCFKAKPRNEIPIMADLPSCRVQQQAKAFVHTGVDYMGPILVVPHRRRGVRSQKAYVCLFVCLVTKAVHIELAGDLSTDSFLNCLKRFLSRRGPVSTIYSDCGTNFIGAKTYLGNMYELLSSEVYKDRFANELRDNRIKFKPNPPASPHMGGIWESNIRSLKMHLHRVVGNQLLTVEEMTTVLAQIEAVLNSRPLTVLSSDPLTPLTPAHFLTLTPLKSLPSEDLSKQTLKLTERKRMVDQMVQSFWRRWQLEYLNTLQSRQKWLQNTQAIRPGTVVLLQSNDSAPLDWPIGLIDKVYPDKEGVVRIVDVRTKFGVYRRPVVKVYPLPTQ